ncbi:nucleotidyltransferase family protein [Shewanella donghaensis]|uniref:nucleotidyltransferase family protein n=1 Tax=Shewanella donghaensis TaxID=238836 RepID=UPI00118211BB|nr:nucleotidyltransferase family protein [Shewanella donghaensis]
MNYEAQLKTWILEDKMRVAALQQVADLFAELNITDWYIAAGFVRNLVWDKQHQASFISLNDVDVIYYCTEEISVYRDRLIELALSERLTLPWSVKNQARMHEKNNHPAYTSTLDAMSYWPEQQTAVAVKLNAKGELEIEALFGFESLFSLSVSYNPKADEQVFMERVASKPWFKQYPQLSLAL